MLDIETKPTGHSKLGNLPPLPALSVILSLLTLTGPLFRDHALTVRSPQHPICTFITSARIASERWPATSAEGYSEPDLVVLVSKVGVCVFHRARGLRIPGGMRPSWFEGGAERLRT